MTPEMELKKAVGESEGKILLLLVDEDNGYEGMGEERDGYGSVWS